MLEKGVVKKINDFVFAKPRTIQEISHIIGKSWITTDRYIEKIAAEEGTVSVRTFRGGTKGALKIVYWNLNPVQASSFQERMLKQIESGRHKSDFSASEIFQHVDEKKREAFYITDNRYHEKENYEDLKKLLMNAESQVLSFSGNLTFCNIGNGKKKIFDVIEFLAEKGVKIKILTRVELAGLENIKKVLALNEKIGKDAIEIRHCYQPLRVNIIDSKILSLKEVKDPRYFSEGELKEPISIIYRIYDEEWVEWMQKVFWNLFRTSVSAEKRIKDLEQIKKF
ncbi:hypothetical protein KY311_00890 [Candidatus Woesearchaeota archaeon]|nr:hypothetical protein [Candidatus Woesearchaeota archaeon]